MEREYNQENKTSKNWDASFLIMNDNSPVDGYLAIKKKNKLTGNLADDKIMFKDYYDLLTDAKSRVQAESEWLKYSNLNPLCERLLLMSARVTTIRESKDQSFLDLKAYEKMLEAAHDEERETAKKINADHVLADDKKIGITELFPTVQCGFCIVGVDGIECENWPYEHITRLMVS
jgi:hypothetical protein